MGDLAERPVDSSSRFTLNVRLPTALTGGDGELGDVQHAPAGAQGGVLSPGEAAATLTAAGQPTGRGDPAQQDPSCPTAEGTGGARDSDGGQPQGDGTPGPDQAREPTADAASLAQGREDYVLTVLAQHRFLLLCFCKYLDHCAVDLTSVEQVGEDGATVVRPSSRHASDNLVARSLHHAELPHLQALNAPGGAVHPWEDRDRRHAESDLASLLLGIKSRAAECQAAREANFVAVGAKLEVSADNEVKLSLKHSPGCPTRRQATFRTVKGETEISRLLEDREVKF